MNSLTGIGSEPRPAFNRIVVLRYRSHLESRQLAPGTVNLRLGAVRRLAYEAADCGFAQRGLGRRYSPGQRRQEAGCTLRELAYGRTGPCPLAAAR
jgi:hypothetical protein